MIKCPNKDCENEWKEENVNKIITCCGGNLSVCNKCKQEGFSVYNGKGDGLFYLYKNGKEINVYNEKIAYNIKLTPNEIHNYILEELFNESLPCLDNIKEFELQQYSDFLKESGFIEKDVEDNWSCREMTQTFNNYFKELGSETRLSFIRSSNKLVKDINNSDYVYFTMFTKNYAPIVWFDVENIKFGYLIDDDQIITKL